MNDNSYNNQIKNKKQYSKQLQSRENSSQQERHLHFSSYIKQLNDTSKANHNSNSQSESVSTIRGESEDDYNYYFENHPFVVISQHSSQQYLTPQLLSESEEEIFTEFSDSGSERI